MIDWHPDRKKKFRGDILRLLAIAHDKQRSRMSDTEICVNLKALAIDCELPDVVTILQEMKDRDWVTFRQIKNIFPRRVQLLEVQILPDGRDLVEQTTENPAVIF